MGAHWGRRVQNTLYTGLAADGLGLQGKGSANTFSSLCQTMRYKALTGMSVCLLLSVSLPLY